jgi:hypothetical protein
VDDTCESSSWCPPPPANAGEPTASIAAAAAATPRRRVDVRILNSHPCWTVPDRRVELPEFRDLGCTDRQGNSPIDLAGPACRATPKRITGHPSGCTITHCCHYRPGFRPHNSTDQMKQNGSPINDQEVDLRRSRDDQDGQGESP